MYWNSWTILIHLYDILTLIEEKAPLIALILLLCHFLIFLQTFNWFHRVWGHLLPKPVVKVPPFLKLDYFLHDLLLFALLRFFLLATGVILAIVWIILTSLFSDNLEPLETPEQLVFWNEFVIIWLSRRWSQKKVVTKLSTSLLLHNWHHFAILKIVLSENWCLLINLTQSLPTRI